MDGCTAVWIGSMPLSCTLKNGHNGKFYVRYIYHSVLNLHEERLPRENGMGHRQSGEMDLGQEWWFLDQVQQQWRHKSTDLRSNSWEADPSILEATSCPGFILPTLEVSTAASLAWAVVLTPSSARSLLASPSCLVPQAFLHPPGAWAPLDPCSISSALSWESRKSPGCNSQCFKTHVGHWSGCETLGYWTSAPSTPKESGSKATDGKCQTVCLGHSRCSINSMHWIQILPHPCTSSGIVGKF